METVKRKRVPAKIIFELDHEECEVSQRQLMNMWWLFYCREDKKVFELNFNHSSWPKHFTSLDKLALQPKDTVSIRANGIDYQCQFVKRIDVRSVKDLRRRALDVLENADETIEQISLSESFTNNQLIEENKENDHFDGGHEPSDGEMALCSQTSTTPLAKVPKKSYEQSSIDLRAVTSTPAEDENTPVMSVLRAVLNGHEKAMERILKQHEEANTQVMLEMRKNRHEMSKLLKVIHSSVCGRSTEENHVPAADQELNDDFVKPPFMFNGRDLSKESVDPDPSHFGRRIARILFGDKGECELIDAMIDPDFSRHPNRMAADAVKVETLKNTVLWAYRGKGITLALRTWDIVKTSVNQMGRDLKRDYQKPVATTTNNTPANNQFI